MTYVRFPAIADRLPAGRSWVRADAQGGLGVGTGLDLSELDRFTQDPRELLQVLRGVSGGVETVGTEELRGVPTTHYRAVLDPSSHATLVPAEDRDEARAADELFEQSGLGAVPLDISVDGSGLVRKFEMSITATQPGASEATSASLGFELWDLGERVRVEVPHASQVADASSACKGTMRSWRHRSSSASRRSSASTI